MLTYKKTYNIHTIKNEWLSLQNSGALNSPFQEYEYIKISSSLFFPYYISNKYIAMFYTFYEDGECVMILPLVKYLKGRRAELFANVNGLNYCDILSKDKKYILPALRLLTKEYDGSIYCNNILESSQLYSILSNLNIDNRTINNVCISFGEDYSVYNKSLSKSTRQNLRTAYNRLDTDGRNIELKVLYGGDKSLDYKPFLTLYCQRHSTRYNVQTNRLKKWFLLHLNFSTVNYIKNHNGLTIALYIDGKLASFMSGMLGRQNEYVVPRLSINDEYGFYSPGMILINEAIKYFMSNTSVRHLDLSQGEEPYKYKMGGTVHYTHSFKLELKSII